MSGTSEICGDTRAGFDTTAEYLAGTRVCPADLGNRRLNSQVNSVSRSPVRSTVGYSVGGQPRTTDSIAFQVRF
jgi:hypothetical protein